MRNKMYKGIIWLFVTLFVTIEGRSQCGSICNDCNTNLSFLCSMSQTGTKTFKSQFDFEAGGGYTISSGSNITFQAGEEIILKAGFIAPQNSAFTAKIESCQPFIPDKLFYRFQASWTSCTPTGFSDNLVTSEYNKTCVSYIPASSHVELHAAYLDCKGEIQPDLSLLGQNRTKFFGVWGTQQNQNIRWKYKPNGKINFNTYYSETPISGCGNDPWQLVLSGNAYLRDGWVGWPANCPPIQDAIIYPELTMPNGAVITWPQTKLNITGECSSFSFVTGVFREGSILKQFSTSYSLFPNPNSGSFTISFPDASASYEVKVSDVLGNLVFSDVATELASKEFTLPNVSNGLYIVDVKGGGTSYKQKVQVLK